MSWANIARFKFWAVPFLSSSCTSFRFPHSFPLLIFVMFFLLVPWMPAAAEPVVLPCSFPSLACLWARVCTTGKVFPMFFLFVLFLGDQIGQAACIWCKEVELQPPSVSCFHTRRTVDVPSYCHTRLLGEAEAGYQPGIVERAEQGRVRCSLAQSRKPRGPL